MSSKSELVFERLKHRIRQSPEFMPWFQKFLKRPPVSLRMLEHFVSSYAKRHNTTFPVSRRKNARVFHVHDSYKAQIKAYTRGMFDAFRRKGSAPIALPSLERRPSKVTEMETSMAQLNFLFWVWENGILDYVLEHAPKIVKDIETHEKRVKRTETTTKPTGSTRNPPSSRSVNIPVPKGCTSLHLTFK